MEQLINAERVIDEFEQVSKDAGRVQRQVLAKILEDNAECEYLKKHGLNGQTDPESFKSLIPVVSHQDLEPYLHKMIDDADGLESSILTTKPITSMSLTSGTTQGKPKFVPFNDELYETTMQTFHISFAFRNREFPVGKGKALALVYSSKNVKTTSGVFAGTATTNLFRHPNYKSDMKALRSPFCSPEEVIFGADFQQSLYCHLLCGLLSRDEIEVVSSTFAHSIVHTFETFEQVWEQLCADIRYGTLSEEITDVSMRNVMSKKMLVRPNPEKADLMHSICSDIKKNNNGWKGLVPALFPNVKYILGIMTGSMEPYLNKLRRYAGAVPLMYADYGASEGWIGANIHPGLAPESGTFAVLPNVGFFEFLPVKNICNGEFHEAYSEPKPVGLTEVEVGEEYEVIVTSVAGLYRYKLGDLVKVTGFHNSTPEIKFIRRKNLILTLNIDKNTEKDLQLSVEQAANILSTYNNQRLEVIDFTSQIDKSSEPGHYIIYWELNNNGDMQEQDTGIISNDDDHEDGGGIDDILQECCNCLDRSFVDAGYVSSRKTCGIGPLELRILQKGTFNKLMVHSLDMGGTVSQFKTPRCVPPGNKSVLQILFDNVVKSYFSTAYL